MSDWKTALAEHPVVQALGWKYDAAALVTNPELCPEFLEPPALPELPWDEAEADCE